MSERRAVRAETELDQPRLIGGDDVNQPGSRRRPSQSSPLPSAPAPGPSSAMWMLVALVMGAAIGAVTGTVAALLIFG